jgi:hypothetical protein
MTNLMEMPTVMSFLAPVNVAKLDIGRWVAHMLDNPGTYLGEAVEIAGDEVTFPGMISACELVYGSRPRTKPLPTSVLQRGDPVRMFTWISRQGYRANRAAIPGLLPSSASSPCSSPCNRRLLGRAARSGCRRGDQRPSHGRTKDSSLP